MNCVVDWHDVCLVCLQKSESQCIFQKDEGTGLSIADKIMRCSDFTIIENTEQPNSICLMCLSDLNIAYKFRQNCEQASSIINAILNENDRELEISGLRIKIPTDLKVAKKVRPENSEIVIESNEIKHEEFDESKSSVEECENFDAAEYMDSTEILDDVDQEDEEENKEEFQSAMEVIEKLEFISELHEQNTQQVIKETFETPDVPEKRGRGRPKKYNKTVVEYDDSEQEPVTPARRGFSKKHKPPPEPKPQKICEICGNSYKFQHTLNSHMRRHRNERPFNCDFCDKAFVSAVELRRHMRVHTGQKPYKCSFCERRFSDYGSRIKHERTHTGERPYACATCGKSFAYAHVLTVHMRTHTGEKKYICTECGRGFTKKLYLDNHMAHHIAGTMRKTCHSHYDISEKCEASKAVETIANTDVYDAEMQIDSFPCPSSKVKPKEELCEEVHGSDLYSINHVSVP